MSQNILFPEFEKADVRQKAELALSKKIQRVIVKDGADRHVVEAVLARLWNVVADARVAEANKRPSGATAAPGCGAPVGEAVATGAPV